MSMASQQSVIPSASEEPSDNRHDRILVQRLRGHSKPLKLWSLVHAVVQEQNPPTREARRTMVSQLLCRIRFLLRLGVIARSGKTHLYLKEASQSLVPTPLLTATGMTDGYQAAGGSGRKVFKA